MISKKKLLCSPANEFGTDWPRYNVILNYRDDYFQGNGLNAKAKDIDKYTFPAMDLQANHLKSITICVNRHGEVEAYVRSDKETKQREYSLKFEYKGKVYEDRQAIQSREDPLYADFYINQVEMATIAVELPTATVPERLSVPAQLKIGVGKDPFWGAQGKTDVFAGKADTYDGRSFGSLTVKWPTGDKVADKNARLMYCYNEGSDSMGPGLWNWENSYGLFYAQNNAGQRKLYGESGYPGNDLMWHTRNGRTVNIELLYFRWPDGYAVWATSL